MPSRGLMTPPWVWRVATRLILHRSPDRPTSPTESARVASARGRAPVPALVVAFLLLDLLICLAHLANIGAGRPSVKLTAFLDLEKEGNLPTWYSSMQLFLAGALAAVFAWLSFERRARRSWALWLLPALFLLLSLDEIAEIHEYLGYRTDALLPGGDRKATPFAYTGIWTFVIALPALAAMIGMFAALRGPLERHGAHRRFLVGAAVLVLGAAGGDLVANFVVIGSGAHVAEVFLEELLEMVGATMLLWGSYSLARGCVAPLVRRAPYRLVRRPAPRVGAAPARGGLSSPHAG